MNYFYKKVLLVFYVLFLTSNLFAQNKDDSNIKERTTLEQEFNDNLIKDNMDGAIQILNEMASKYYNLPVGFKENIINVLTLFGEKNEQTKDNFEFLGYLMVNLYPMMMEPKYLDEDGYSDDNIPWRAKIMLALANNIHKKILASSNNSDYTKGMSNIYDLIDIYINNIPQEAIDKEDLTNTKVLTAYLMVETLKSFGLPLEKEDFLNKRSKK